MSKETVTVYWAVHTHPKRQTYVNMLWDAPTPLITTLPQGFGGKDGNYRECSGISKTIKNTYTFIHPLTTKVELSGNPEDPTFNSDLNVWNSRSAALKDCYSINYDFGWLFFAEESLELKVTPPYLHNTSDSKTGFVASGSFDISKWFRPVTLAYVLWQGNNSLTVTKGDPALYVEFLTDKKVIFKHFELTEDIHSLALQSVESTNYMRFKPLSYRYQQFTSSHRDKRVLKLIKDNLLE
jgi:hypothetical protein